MRNAVRKRRSESEEESVFVSMTDMTVSFLFIVMILMAFFASQFRPDELVAKAEFEEVKAKLEEVNAELEVVTAKFNKVNDEREKLKAELEEVRAEFTKVKRQLNESEQTVDKQAKEIERLTQEIALLKEREVNAIEEYAKAADAARARIIAALQERVQEAIPDIKVTISESGDILRFRGDEFFKRNRSEITEPRIRQVVEALAEGLAELLPCFTLGNESRWDEGCNPDAVLADAVQIEGHTDSEGSLNYNLELSLRRGAETFRVAQGHRPVLLEYRNVAMEPVLSVSGYGETRPIATNDTRAGRGSNRRIDLRLIMASVGDSDEIVQIRQRLEGMAATAWQERGVQ